jgi:hypothetical protein
MAERMVCAGTGTTVEPGASAEVTSGLEMADHQLDRGAWSPPLAFDDAQDAAHLSREDAARVLCTWLRQRARRYR